MNERKRFGRQKHFVKFNVSYLTGKSNLKSKQGRIKVKSIGGICPGGSPLRNPQIIKNVKFTVVLSYLKTNSLQYSLAYF